MEKEEVTHQNNVSYFPKLGASVRSLLNIKGDLDKSRFVESTKKNAEIKGANAWLLMCSIMIASLGLDLNSPAIIIGAMLISPLMSPILGVGLGIGTSDRSTLFISLRHFSIAIGIAIFTSTVYFFLTPIASITDEIVRRTEPTFLDVLVAFFGGTAGTISGMQKENSNAIPGVAIATALMPPLCVTGFGLATWLKIQVGLSQDGTFKALAFIGNSFYLFHLNAFFVALATFIVVRYLRFPLQEYDDKRKRMRTKMWVATISLALAAPSFVLLRDVITKVKDQQRKDQFLSETFGEDMKYIDECLLVYGPEGKRMILKVYGPYIKTKDVQKYEDQLESFGLDNTQLEIIPTSEVDLHAFKKLQLEVNNMTASVEERIIATQVLQSQTRQEIDRLHSILDSLDQKKAIMQDLTNQIQIFVDGIQSITSSYDTQIDSVPMMAISIHWSPEKSNDSRQEDRLKIERLIHDVYHRDDIALITD